MSLRRCRVSLVQGVFDLPSPWVHSSSNSFSIDKACTVSEEYSESNFVASAIICWLQLLVVGLLPTAHVSQTGKSHNDTSYIRPFFCVVPVAPLALFYPQDGAQQQATGGTKEQRRGSCAFNPTNADFLAMFTLQYVSSASPAPNLYRPREPPSKYRRPELPFLANQRRQCTEMFPHSRNVLATTRERQTCVWSVWEGNPHRDISRHGLDDHHGDVAVVGAWVPIPAVPIRFKFNITISSSSVLTVSLI